eukprot:TRINITY_DN1660_c0_g1_i1.p1 TRINITY_DN1660_c0_g1~~TRINITY_DN1660_c0_g1_i1.p1  ORF type:complete len:257 (+),score=36.77 TRINITY_DN1660_c0_g1_i1:65-835(+)
MNSVADNYSVFISIVSFILAFLSIIFLFIYKIHFTFYKIFNQRFNILGFVNGPTLIFSCLTLEQIVLLIYYLNDEKGRIATHSFFTLLYFISLSIGFCSLVVWLYQRGYFMQLSKDERFLYFSNEISSPKFVIIQSNYLPAIIIIILALIYSPDEIQDLDVMVSVLFFFYFLQIVYFSLQRKKFLGFIACVGFSLTYIPINFSFTVNWLLGIAFTVGRAFFSCLLFYFIIQEYHSENKLFMDETLSIANKSFRSIQ